MRDTSRVYVAIGLGFHLECDLGQDAPRVIGLRKQVGACMGLRCWVDMRLMCMGPQIGRAHV